jgi:choline dehydrogenase
LQDHTEGALAANATQPWADNPNELCFADLSPNGPCFMEWFQDGAGPLGEGSAPQVVRIKTSQSTTGQVDIWTVGLSNALARGFYPGYSHPLEAPSTWSWVMVKIHAPGRFTNGTVTLQSADPRIPPEINFDWLQGEEGERDLAALSEGAELLMKAFEAAPEQYQPIVRHAPAENEDLSQGFRDEAFGHHASSTCRMGPVDDENACVDPELRVKGVKNLRVADASVFPYTPGAFPAMAFHMVGLKAADLLHDDA